MFNSNKIGTRNQICRDEWVINVLKNISDGKRILDAGAGQLRYKQYCSHLQYVSQDFCEYSGQGDQKGLQYDKWDTSKIDIVSDITQIPEPNEYFDVILCTEVIEHIPDPISAFREFHRLLKTNGILILTAPFNSLTHFAPYYYYSGFSQYFYYKHLNDIGFEIVEISENGNYFEYLAQEIRRLPYITEKYCNSKLNFFERQFIKLLLYLLYKLNKIEKNSSELLCFGYHIKALKK